MSAAHDTKTLPDEEQRYFAPLLARLAPRNFRIEAVDGKGKGLKTATGFKPAEVLFVEEPLVSHQFFDNRRVAQTCAHCHRFIGTLLTQLNKLATVTIPAHEAAAVPPEEVAKLAVTYEGAFPSLPTHLELPAIDKDACRLSDIVPCAFGCAAEYCSEACRAKALRQYHLLLCPAFDESGGKVGKIALSTLSHASHSGCTHADGEHAHHHDEEDEESDDDDEGEGGGDDVNAAALFEHQALAANEILLFTGKAVGRILEAWARNGNNMEEALRPFTVLHAAPWWTIFAAREAGEEEKRKALRQLEGSDDDEDEDEDEEEVAKGAGGAGADEDEDDEPRDEHSEWAQQTKADLLEYMLDSLVILRSLTKSRVPHIVKLIREAAGGSGKVESADTLREFEFDMLFDVGLYERLISALELNSLEIKIDSPVRDYLQAIRSLPRESKSGKPSPYDQAMAILFPILSQIRSARSARKALTKALEAATAGSDDEDDDEEEFEDSDSESDDEEAAPGEIITDAVLDKYLPLSEGSAVFALISNMNHHCEPNVQIAYADGDRNAVVMAMREIHPEEELHINYVDIEQPAVLRRADLKHYGFHCGCHRCIKEDAEEAKE